MTTIAAQTVEYRALRSQRNRSAWWTDEIKEAIERKRRAYKKMIQRNVVDEIRVNRTEYKLLNRNVKEMVQKIKRKVDGEFGIKLNDKFNDNEKLGKREE